MPLCVVSRDLFAASLGKFRKQIIIAKNKVLNVKKLAVLFPDAVISVHGELSGEFLTSIQKWTNKADIAKNTQRSRSVTSRCESCVRHKIGLDVLQFTFF